jgi:hypothetical protein
MILCVASPQMCPETLSCLFNSEITVRLYLWPCVRAPTPYRTRTIDGFLLGYVCTNYFSEGILDAANTLFERHLTSKSTIIRVAFQYSYIQTTSFSMLKCRQPI